MKEPKYVNSVVLSSSFICLPSLQVMELQLRFFNPSTNFIEMNLLPGYESFLKV